MDKIIKREIWTGLVADLKSKQITVLLGPRQVGKTTLILGLIEYLGKTGVKPENIFYYNFDDVNLRGSVKKDPFFIKRDIEQKIGHLLEEEGSQFYLFLDEGQKSPSVFDLVKILHDRRLNIKTFISGSSSLNIKDKSAETLSGRVNYFYLSPLSFSEGMGENLGFYQMLENIQNEKEIMEMAAAGYRHLEKNKSVFQKMLFSGGMPKIFTASLNESISYLNNFLSSYLDKDIKEAGAKVDIENFHLSFKYLSSYCGDLFNFSKLSGDLGIKRDSLYRYFELLEKTLVVRTVSPFIFPQAKNIFKSRKLFFFDTGIVNRLKGFMNFEELDRAGFTGKVFENFIFQNLFAKSLNDIKKPDFFYFRDYQNHEIDLIYERGGVTIPIEISYSNSIDNRKLRNFSSFFSTHPPAKYGIIFYLGEIRTIDIGKKHIFAVPFFMV